MGTLLFGEKWNYSVCLSRVCVCVCVCVVCVWRVCRTDLSPISFPPKNRAILQRSKRPPLTSLPVDQVLRFQRVPLSLSEDCALSVSLLLYQFLFFSLSVCIAAQAAARPVPAVCVSVCACVCGAKWTVSWKQTNRVFLLLLIISSLANRNR